MEKGKNRPTPGYETACQSLVQLVEPVSVMGKIAARKRSIQYFSDYSPLLYFKFSVMVHRSKVAKVMSK